MSAAAQEPGNGAENAAPATRVGDAASTATGGEAPGRPAGAARSPARARSGSGTGALPLLVLDTSAILQGAWNGPGAGCVAPPAVAQELSPGGRDHARWERLVATGLRVEEPAQLARDAVAAAARRLGETRLSRTDREVAALAATLRGRGDAAQVVTDDYALQNVLQALGLAWRGTREKGITETRAYGLRCAGCGRWWGKEHAEGDDCPVCGSMLARKRKA